MSSHTDRGRDYQDAKASVGAHRRIQADAELAVARWLRKKAHMRGADLYDADGNAKHPELVALIEARTAAMADVQWCRSLVVACGEAVKGQSFAEVMEGHA